MRQFRPNRTTVLLGLVLAGATGVSQADFPLRFLEEDGAWSGAMVVDRDIATGTTLTTVGVRQPMLCSNFAVAARGTRLATVQPGFTPSNGDFKFGPMDTTKTSRPPLSLSGVQGWRYTSGGLELQPYDDTLACYVLSAVGVRKPSAHLFNDTFSEGTTGPNASLAARVVALPDGENDYKYFIDVNIPAEFAGRRYVVTDGFDSSIFSSELSRYCAPADPAATVCSGQQIIQNSVNYPDLTTPAGLQVVPAGGLTKRFIVIRPLKSGVFSLPANPNQMVTSAALFIAPPAGLTAGPEEMDLSDNVAIGRSHMSDLDPVISTPFIPALAEGSGATGLSFVLTDDTSEVGMPPLNAAVTIQFQNQEVPASNVSCLVGTPQAGETTRRNCTFDIPVIDPNFATDAVAGTYAPGVSASVRIVATDGRNQTTTRIVPLHVVGSDNDQPTFSLSKALEDPGPTNGDLPTLRCVVQPQQAGLLNQTPECQGLIEGFVLDRKPGPAYAFDELFTQGTVFAGVDANNKLSCTGSIPSIFSFNGANSPRFVDNGGRIDLSYSLTGSTGYADCLVTVGDSNYPAGQNYAQSQVQFRILVALPPAP